LIKLSENNGLEEAIVRILRIIAGALLLFVANFSLLRPAFSQSIWDGVFSAEQTQRGDVLYQEHCASCHGAELVSSDPDYPNLTAPQFRWNWGKKTLAERLQRVRSSMPPNAKDSLAPQEYLDIITFILKSNGYPAGAAEIKADSGALIKIVVDPPKQ
jgi:mono/diheme cytochrome c family protein